MALDRQTIVDVALTLVDDVGVDGLSTRVLAARLGVKGPSLYWHFKSMRELLDHMGETMLAEVLPSADPLVSPGDWSHWLAEGARGIRRAAMSRRDGARILACARPTGTRSLNFGAMVRRLQRDGFSERDARAALAALARYAMGWALGEQMARGPTAASDADFEFGLQAMLRGLAEVREHALSMTT